jgi:hypothetical protein
VGAGYRIFRNLDAEIKVLHGRVMENFMATAIQAGVTFRF